MTTPSYPKGDTRRLLALLAAIDALAPSATLVKIAAMTGMPKRSITDLIDQAWQVGVTLAKDPLRTLRRPKRASLVRRGRQAMARFTLLPTGGRSSAGAE